VPTFISVRQYTKNIITGLTEGKQNIEFFGGKKVT
jgi:hypothetical protein